MLYSYDYSTQTIFAYSHSNLSCSVYKIGQLFVNFLNNDYQKYDEKRIFLRNLCCSNTWQDDFFEKFPLIKNYWCEYMGWNTVDFKQHDAVDILNIDAQTPYFSAYIAYDESVPNVLRDKFLFDLKYLQNRIIDTYVTCIDVDKIKNNSPILKYMNNEGLSYEMNGIHFTEKTVFRYNYTHEEDQAYNSSHQAITPNKYEIALNPFWEHAASDDYPDFMKYPKVNDECAKREIKVIHGYIFKSVQEALQCEFLKMLELGIKIRKCAVCGKYFIVTGHNGNCCDNLYKDTGLTCQQVFADRNYKNKRKQNPILKEYDKAYKRMYARYSNKKNLASDEYTKWKNEAARERDKALKAYVDNPSDEVINNFKQFLGNK